MNQEKDALLQDLLQNEALRTAILGAVAGAAGGIAQPVLGKLEEALGFRRGEDADVPVHFVQALSRQAGTELSGPAAWMAGAGFHVGYALFWGGVYAAVRERSGVSPAVGGLGLAAVLYAAAFSRAGAGVLSGAEPHPDRRPLRWWMLLTTMPLVYGLTTAGVYERLRRWRTRRQDEREVSADAPGTSGGRL